MVVPNAAVAAAVVDVPVLLLLPLAPAPGVGEVEAGPGTNSWAEGLRLLRPLPLLAPGSVSGSAMLIGWLLGVGDRRVGGAPLAYRGALPASAAAAADAAVAAATAELLLLLLLVSRWLPSHRSSCSRPPSARRIASSCICAASASTSAGTQRMEEGRNSASCMVHKICSPLAGRWQRCDSNDPTAEATRHPVYLLPWACA